MKHIYIITMILSSFFTYNHLYAKDNSLQYAFFIPQDAFQHNIFDEPTQVDITPNTSYNKTAPVTQKEKTTEAKPLYKKLSTTPKSASNSSIKKQTNTKEDKQSKLSSTKENQLQKTTKLPIKDIIKTFSKTKTISEMLSKIPYPSDNMPKYKKAYLDYIMSLRILYRTKKLQPNMKQEATLSKANSLKRFNI